NALDPNGTYIFQIGTTLTTASAAAIVLAGGSDPNIFWQVGSSATLGTNTIFDGNVLALTSITLDSGATISVGRALAQNGAVTMDTNSVNLGAPAPPPIVVSTYWNGTVSANWSGANWSPTSAGGDNETLAPGANVVFSVNPAPGQPLNENTNLNLNELISSLTVNTADAVSISGPNTLIIAGAAGALSTITINFGAGLTTINSSVLLGGLSQGIDVENTAGLLITGTVSGDLGLTKTGVGGVVLTGANTYTGGTAINAGILAVGDSTGHQSSTALGVGSVVNAATLETTASVVPLSAAIKINVNGDYTQTGPNGLLQLQVVVNQGPATTQAAAGLDYDTLAATGNVSIGGAINLNFETGSAPGQRFQVASTSGPNGITNPGSPIPATVTGTPYIPITTYNDSFGGTYAAHSVVVTLYQPFAFQGLTPNQTNVAQNIDSFVTDGFAHNLTVQNTSAATDFFNNIVTGLTIASASPGALGHALDELSPQRFEILRNVAFDNYALDVQSLDDEFARERNGVGGVDTAGFVLNDSSLGAELSEVKSRLLAWSPAPEPGLLSDSTQAVLGGVDMSDTKNLHAMSHTAPLNLWNGFVDGGVDLGDLDSNMDENHSSYTTGRVRGGIDLRVTSEIRVGALFGYGHTDVDLDNEGSKAQVDSFTPGVYATYADKKGFYANGLFTGTLNEYSTDRNIIIPGVNRTATGNTSGTQFGGDLDGGYEFHRGDWTFGPSAGLTYVNLGIDNFSESGASSANLAVNDQSASSLRSRLGGTVRYQGRIGSITVTPHLSAYWQHEFLDNPGVITSQFEGLPTNTFDVHTTPGAKDNALLGFGVDADITANVTLFVDYQTEAGGSSFFGQSASAGVKLGF
ncbi:MAG TPA: autotransporter domain-containing protein, partial [Candidatus Methylacidiphilales bacterium]